MEREHTVNLKVTNGAECICNPEILLGTNQGLWNIEKEVAPRGTLLDLNAAWELFLSRKALNDGIEFKETYHHQHEIIDGIVYEDGDTTYTLMDDKGNPTKATFTIKANKGPVEHIEWEDGNLILYYSKTRPVTQEDEESGVPLHYVYDEDGSVIIDEETGKPLIYDYVNIPIIEIFDNDETHKLFPWFADDQHTVRTRQTLDEDTNEHLGDFAITKDSEVFIAKERFPDNEGNTLISLQSVYDQLKKDLGVTHSVEVVSDLEDKEGKSIHERVNGNNLNNILTTENKNSVVGALNELLTRSKNQNIVDFGIEIPLENPKDTLRQISASIKDRSSLVAALNWIQDVEIGDFTDFLNFDALNITEALNIIYEQAINNRDRIGFDGSEWIVLNTDNKNSLTEAINEVDTHIDELAKIAGVQEVNHSYRNNDLNNTLKNRIRPNSVIKYDTTLIEDINELQNQIGNLDTDKSKDYVNPQLTTDNKNNLVEAINEVDLHTDNNTSNIGNLSSLTTDEKTTIVEAINELDSDIGDLNNLNTNNKENLVEAINEVIEESPFVYCNEGIVAKDNNNYSDRKAFVAGEDNSGEEYSIVAGFGNKVSKNSAVFGNGNFSSGDYSILAGDYNENSSNGDHSVLLGDSNRNYAKESVLLGSSNITTGNSGERRPIREVLIGYNNFGGSSSVVGIGDNNSIYVRDSMALGSSNNINSPYSHAFGIDNKVNSPNSKVVGEHNELGGGTNNHTFGRSNLSQGTSNFVVGESNNIVGTNNVVIGNDRIITGDNNISIGVNAQNINTSNTIIIGELENIHSNSTHIGKDIYIQSHDSESKLQSLIFVDLNDWCKKNNSASLNGEKFLDTSHVVQALKVYISKEYSDNALLRFKMQDNNENGFIIIQGKSTRIYLNGSWYFSDSFENGWSRHEGTYLKVIPKKIVTPQGETITKHYLAFMDQLSTEAIVDTVGAQRSNTEDFGTIDLTHAYGAVDIDDISDALNLTPTFNNKVDKSAKIITNYYDSSGVKSQKSQNWIDLDYPNLSANITLDLKESFGFDKSEYQKLNEKGQVNGYAPIDGSGKIPSQYLPSYVDDVIDVWAEYDVDGKTGAVINIKLYEVIYTTVPTTGQEVPEKGAQILTGEVGKIYIEANNSDNGKFSCQFRWTGSKFVAIGFSNIVIGEVEGTAFDGARGVALEEGLQDHLNSGTTTIPDLDGSGNQKIDENGNLLWKIYKPNPHNVQASQLLVTVNDPNDINNTELEDPYYREYTVESALIELFDRINVEEDKTSSISSLIGSPQEIEELGDKSIVKTLLETKELAESFVPLSESQIDDIVTKYLKFYGED